MSSARSAPRAEACLRHWDRQNLSQLMMAIHHRRTNCTSERAKPPAHEVLGRSVLPTGEFIRYAASIANQVGRAIARWLAGKPWAFITVHCESKYSSAPPVVA